MTDPDYMRRAIRKAKAGIAEGQTPFGACVVRDGRVLACAHNTVWAETDATAHAEINALREACRRAGTIDLAGSVVYSTCEPCPMCFSACLWARVSRVVFGARIEDAARCGFNEIPVSDRALLAQSGKRVALVEDLLREECLALFDAWARRGRRAY